MAYQRDLYPVGRSQLSLINTVLPCAHIELHSRIVIYSYAELNNDNECHWHIIRHEHDLMRL